MVAFANLPLGLGPVAMSPAAAVALAGAQMAAFELLTRHAAGDWGHVDDDERLANWVALSSGAGLVCSAYRLDGNATILIATEMTPRQTSILLAEEVLLWRLWCSRKKILDGYYSKPRMSRAGTPSDS